LKVVLVDIRSVSDNWDALTNVAAGVVSKLFRSSTGVAKVDTVESLEGVDGVVGNFLPGRLGALEYDEDEDEEDDPLEGSGGIVRTGRLVGVS
jgi:hypothetical protein